MFDSPLDEKLVFLVAGWFLLASIIFVLQTKLAEIEWPQLNFELSGNFADLIVHVRENLFSRFRLVLLFLFGCLILQFSFEK